MNNGMIDAVQLYLALLRSPPEAAHERVGALAEALDRLAFARHSTPAIQRDDVPDLPDVTPYTEMRAIAAATFPDFGVYAVVTPDENPLQQAMMGDAIDDLADIALDMERVEQLWEKKLLDEANWHYRFWYGAHWGRHLHDLRSYVHARQFEGER